MRRPWSPPDSLVGEICRYTEQDRICIPVPFYHCFGMVMGNLAATSHGACMVIPAPAFDPAATLAAVAQERCTSLYGVPTMFIAEWALLEGEGATAYDLSSVRTGIMAGSPCPAELMKKLIAAGIEEMTICYGMTETSPVSTQTRTDDSFEIKVGTVGRVGPHLEIRIADPVTGQTLPRGEAGEFCTKGYSVMLGYWREPTKTAEAIVDGWMRTGDLAVMDADGSVRITGRIKDMVIRGGENIYPREIEEFLYTHPDIVDAQVVGVPDAKYGEELCAWLRLRPGAEPITPESLREFCSGQPRALQDPALRQTRRGLPDDGDRQGSQGGHARRIRGRARTGRLRSQDRATLGPAKAKVGEYRSAYEWVVRALLEAPTRDVRALGYDRSCHARRQKSRPAADLLAARGRDHLVAVELVSSPGESGRADEPGCRTARSGCGARGRG